MIFSSKRNSHGLYVFFGQYTLESISVLHIHYNLHIFKFDQKKHFDSAQTKGFHIVELHIAVFKLFTAFRLKDQRVEQHILDVEKPLGFFFVRLFPAVRCRHLGRKFANVINGFLPQAVGSIVFVK